MEFVTYEVLFVLGFFVGMTVTAFLVIFYHETLRSAKSEARKVSRD